MCRGTFDEKPIICKLGDLGEVRLQAKHRKTMVKVMSQKWLTEGVQHLWHQKYILTCTCYKLQVLSN